MLIFKTVILPFLDHIPELNFSESSLIPLACIQHARRLSLWMHPSPVEDWKCQIYVRGIKLHPIL